MFIEPYLCDLPLIFKIIALKSINSHPVHLKGTLFKMGVILQQITKATQLANFQELQEHTHVPG